MNEHDGWLRRRSGGAHDRLLVALASLMKLIEFHMHDTPKPVKLKTCYT
jgi:hypothetical protein